MSSAPRPKRRRIDPPYVKIMLDFPSRTIEKETKFDFVDDEAHKRFNRFGWRAGPLPAELRTPITLVAQRPGWFRDAIKVSYHMEHLFISDRLRSAFERLAGDDVEFIPVELTGPGVEFAPSRYWWLHPTRAVDCLDESSFNVDWDGKRFVELPIIDSRRVPPDAKMFMIEHFEVIRLVRRDVWLGLIETGCTGMKFSAIPDVAVHGPVHYVKPDYSKIPRDDPDDGDEPPTSSKPEAAEPEPEPSSKPSSKAASKQPSPRPRKGR